MAETTGIGWTDATFNPWIGCTKVSPGCDHCYAEQQDKFRKWGGKTHWGVGVPRLRTKPANWERPLQWQRHAENGFLPDGKTRHGGRRPRVFCASLADIFDNEVPDTWRRDLFGLIAKTPGLDWQLLTKRIGNAWKMMRDDWGFIEPSPGAYSPRQNIWLGASVVDQAEADRDIPKLLDTPAAKRFISYEPALGDITFKREWLRCPGAGEYGHGMSLIYVHAGDCCARNPHLDWIIVGGESTQGAPARPTPIYWTRSVVKQCRAAGVAPFVKQLGSFVVDRNDAGFDGDGDDLWPEGTADKVEHNPFGYIEEYQGAPVRVRLKDRAGADPSEWPRDLRVQEFPK